MNGTTPHHPLTTNHKIQRPHSQTKNHSQNTLISIAWCLLKALKNAITNKETYAIILYSIVLLLPNFFFLAMDPHHHHHLQANHSDDDNDTIIINVKTSNIFMVLEFTCNNRNVFAFVSFNEQIDGVFERFGIQ